MSGVVAYCGLDVGISTTDAVAEWAPGAAISLATAGAERSAELAVRQLLEHHPPPGGMVIAATGVGSRRLSSRLCGFEIRPVDEMVAIAEGGMALSGGREGLVASLGTGTAMVSVRGAEIRHVTPGNGVGGGTLLGLARALLGTDDLVELSRLSDLGDRRRLDITIGEAVGGPLGVLPEDGTASNFAKYHPGARREDVAAALLNLVAEVVLWTVLLGLQASGHGRAILIGKLTLVAPIRRRIEEFSALLGGTLVLPPGAEVAAALGAIRALRGETKA